MSFFFELHRQPPWPLRAPTWTTAAFPCRRLCFLFFVCRRRDFFLKSFVFYLVFFFSHLLFVFTIFSRFIQVSCTFSTLFRFLFQLPVFFPRMFFLLCFFDLFPNSFLLWAFFYSHSAHMSSSIYREHGTGQRNQLYTEISKACPSERANASKQAKLARASMSSSISSSPCSHGRPRDRNLPGIQQNTTTHKQPCDTRGSPLSPISVLRRYNSTQLSPCILFRSCIRRPRCFLEHRALGICTS